MSSLRAIRDLRAACRSGTARRIREAAGVSQTEVARALGCDPSAVSRWEDGSRTPRAGIAERYAKLLEELAN